VGGVRRNVNLGLLADVPIQLGDYVLIHVGFAMSKIDEREATETLRLLQELGSYDTEVEQFSSSLE
jgi:hydrogenase expression/formation protein HypC